MNISRRSFLGGSIASLAVMFGGFGWKESDALLGVNAHNVKTTEQYSWGNFSGKLTGDKDMWAYTEVDVDMRTGVSSPMKIGYWDIRGCNRAFDTKVKITEAEAARRDPSFVRDSERHAGFAMKRAAKEIMGGTDAA